MKYTRDRFTEEEIKEIESLGSIVCYLFDIDENDLRGTCRKRIFVDARKVLSCYASSNIKPSLYNKYNNYLYKPVAISAWYLNICHTTASYQVSEAIKLYDTDPSFRAQYDALVKFINQDGGVIDLQKAKDDKMSYLTWKDVCNNPKYREYIRMSLVPEDVLNGIIDLYNKGYGSVFISRKYNVVYTFVNYVAYKLKLNPSVKPNIVEKYRILQKNAISKVIDY